MFKEIPDDHPLRKLFRWATKSAFRYNQNLHTGNIEVYISDWLLARFIHRDNLYKIRNVRGKPLFEVVEMLSEGLLTEYKGRFLQKLAFHQYMGDYILFIAGMFPESLIRILGKPGSSDGLLMRIGYLYCPCQSPMDFYLYQGKAAYHKASEMMRELSGEKANILQRLSEAFPAYVNLMSLIRLNLESNSYFKNIKGILDAD